MRLFQNSGVYPAYLQRLRRLTEGLGRFEEQRRAFLDDRYGACHLLLPVLSNSPEAFFTNGDDEALQRAWAREHGMPATTHLADILLAQIEDHQTEVFYNMDPMRYGSDFVHKLPGCVRKSITWRAAPSSGGTFSAYDLLVCNFQSILETYRAQGMRVAPLAPAHDPEMDAYAVKCERPIDVLFVGGYSRHHSRRAAVLEAVASLRGQRKVAFHLDCSRLTRLAESRLGRLLPLAAHRRPRDIAGVTEPPVFGRELYHALSQAKIVLNGAVDMAGEDRGNMRCFESLGCGALMVSDTGRYPEGFSADSTHLEYANAAQARHVIEGALADPDRLSATAAAGHLMICARYSKFTQWSDFQRIVEGL